MDTIIPCNKIPDTCAHLCSGGGDHYCGDIHGVAVYSIGMYNTTLVVATIFFYVLCFVCFVVVIFKNNFNWKFCMLCILGVHKDIYTMYILSYISNTCIQEENLWMVTFLCNYLWVNIMYSPKKET
jgi:hypothetical protein